MYIYHLFCKEEGGDIIKHYVGKTDNIERRYEQHKNGEGPRWTQIFKPFKYEILTESNDSMEEDIWVKKLMKRHGIDRVRGGSYSNVHLTKAQEICLLSELRSMTDKCFNCGSTAHFASRCTNKPKNTNTTPEIKSKGTAVRKCGNCGKAGHNKRTCTLIR